MQKKLMWRGDEHSSIEHCEISGSEAGIEVRSNVTGTAADGTEFEIRYVLELSPAWEAQHIIVRDVANEGNELDLQYENGQWFDVDGLHLEEFDGVGFVDLTITPLTNSLPIRRLQFESGEPQKIDVLLLELPKFNIRRAEQIYSRVGKNTYRFQDVENSNFVRDLVVDDDGLVLVYPGLFTRTAG